MKIWVTNNTGHDLSGSLKYGDDLVYVFNEKAPVFRTDDLIRQVRERVKTFEKEDYLIIIGNSVASAIILSTLFTIHPKIKLLIYNNETTEYVPRTLELEMMKGPKEDDQ